MDCRNTPVLRKSPKCDIAQAPPSFEAVYQDAGAHTPPRGAHLLLQTRTRALDGTLRPLFERWYPGLIADTAGEPMRAAARNPTLPYALQIAGKLTLRLQPLGLRSQQRLLQLRSPCC